VKVSLPFRLSPKPPSLRNHPLTLSLLTVGQKLNGPSGLSARKVKITVIAGGSRIIPVLRAPIGLKAEKMLNKLGVEVLYNSRVARVELGGADTATEKNFDTATGEDSYAQTSGATQVAGGIAESRNQDGSGKTYVYLEDGKKLSADVYIPAAGVTPNTGFLPREWVDADGYVRANKKTLRVDVAGPRVYVVGDVGDYSKGGILDLMSAMPVFATNIWSESRLPSRCFYSLTHLSPRRSRPRQQGRRRQEWRKRPPLQAQQRRDADCAHWSQDGRGRVQWVQDPELCGQDDQGEGLVDGAEGGDRDGE